MPSMLITSSLACAMMQLSLKYTVELQVTFVVHQVFLYVHLGWKFYIIFGFAQDCE